MWVQSVSYPGYEVCEDGRVRNAKTKHEIATHRDKKGYVAVAIYRDGKQRKPKVHRLIAEAFIPNPNMYPQINHKDEDKTNNEVDNLEWCTNAYNSGFGTRTERSAIKHRVPVIAYTPSQKMEFVSIKEAAKYFGCATSSISAALKNGIRCKGFYFKYVKR